MRFQKKMKKERKTIYKEIIRAIRSSQSILITGHEDPDGDSIGSELALGRILRQFGREATIINQGRVPAKYRFLPEIDRAIEFKDFRGQPDFDLVLILECPGVDRTGLVKNLVGAKAKIINIDHHPDNRPFASINYIDETASSVGEMLFELFIAEGLSIDKDTAVLLYTAILTDTGRFRFDSTSSRTMEIIGELITCGVNPRVITDNIYFALPPSILKLTGEALSGITFFENGRICLLQVDREMLENNMVNMSEMDGLADYTLFARDVIVGGLLKEMESGFTKVSLRSRNGINVSQLAHKYGGGGHFNAAGFGIALPLSVARERLLEDLKELVNASI